MAKKVLITDSFFAANRRFTEMSKHLFDHVVTWNPKQRPDLRTLRGKELVVVAALIPPDDMEKIINGLGETGSLEVYTSCPIKYVCDEALIINSVQNNSSIVYSNPKMKLTIYVSHLRAPYENFNDQLILSTGVSLATYNSQFYPICKAFMSRANTFSYDSLHKLDFVKYCGGVIVKEADECNCELEYSIHPDFLDFQSIVPDKTVAKLKFGLNLTYFGKDQEPINVDGPHFLSLGKNYFKVTYYEQEEK